MTYHDVDSVLVLSDMNTAVSEAVIDYIARQMEKNSLLSVRQCGSAFTLDLSIPRAMLAQMALAGGEAEKVPMTIEDSSLRGDARGLQWLRRTIREFLSETGQRLATLAATRGGSAGSCGDVPASVLSPALSSRPIQSIASQFDIRAMLLGFFCRKFGADALVRQAASDILRALQHHRNHDVGAQLFSALLACRAYDEADFRNFLRWWSELQDYSRPGSAGCHVFPLKNFWRCVKHCLATCGFSCATKAAITNRIRNAFMRWLEASSSGSAKSNSSGNVSSFTVPTTIGQPYLFFIPYSTTTLELYVGSAGDMVKSQIAKQSLRLVDSKTIPDTHLLALLLVNTKMERMASSFVCECLSTATEETREVCVDSGAPELDTIVDLGTGDSAGEIGLSLPETANVKEQQSLLSVDVANVFLKAHEEPTACTEGVSLLDHQVRFKEEMKILEKRIAKTMEHYQSVLKNKN